MNPVLRRTLTFVVMVAAGLATIVLLAEDSANPVQPIGKAQRTGGGRGLRVHDRADNTSDGIDLGEVEFSVQGEVTLPDGSVVERPIYRIHIMSGSPDAGGFYVVDRPVITFLDELSGEPLGELSAIQGRFDTGAGGLGSSFGLDMSQLVAEAMSLEGEVRGELPLEDGSLAQLSADRLDVDRRGQTVSGPGLVVWTRDELTLSGHDLHWDGVARELTYASQAKVTVRDAATAALTTLEADGGLRWELPEGGRGRGELRGPVRGSDELGHTLSADTLHADADLGELSLLGSAELREGTDSGARRFAADELRLSRDANGAMRFEEARGQVRAAMIGPDGEISSFECERLYRDGDVLRGPGSVRWLHQGLHAEGRDLRVDELKRELNILHDVLLVGAHDAPEAWRNARLSSPRGLEAAGSQTRLLGPVSGSLPDGTRLGCDTLDTDRDAGSIALLGKAWIERDELDTANEERFEAQELHLWRDAAGAWQRVLAKRQVRVRSRRPGEQDLELLTTELERVGQRVRLSGAFEVRQGPLSLTGVGLLLDELSRQADVHSDAVLSTLGDDQLGAAELRAPAGLTWWFGEQGVAVSEGRGELRGPVTGVDSEGSTISARLVRVHGPAQELELIGEARVARIDGSELSGPELRVRQRPEGALLNAPAEFSLTRELLTVHGSDLRWDEAAQRVDVRGEVVGEHASLGHFAAAGLIAREAEGELELLGPCRLDRADGGWFSAQSALQVRRDEEGQLQSLEAFGGVSAGREQDDVTLSMSATELRHTRAPPTTVLLGDVRIEREDADGLTRLSTDPGATVTVLQNLDGSLQSALAVGRVVIQRGDLRAEADQLAWDVAEDHLSLEGNCRFLALGAWMSMERVEIWPSQMRWFIPRADMEFAPRDDG